MIRIMYTWEIKYYLANLKIKINLNIGNPNKIL